MRYRINVKSILNDSTNTNGSRTLFPNNTSNRSITIFLVTSFCRMTSYINPWWIIRFNFFYNIYDIFYCISPNGGNYFIAELCVLCRFTLLVPISLIKVNRCHENSTKNHYGLIFEKIFAPLSPYHFLCQPS